MGSDLTEDIRLSTREKISSELPSLELKDMIARQFEMVPERIIEEHFAIHIRSRAGESPRAGELSPGAWQMISPKDCWNIVEGFWDAQKEIGSCVSEMVGRDLDTRLELLRNIWDLNHIALPIRSQLEDRENDGEGNGFQLRKRT
jgi:hypothetical protein